MTRVISPIDFFSRSEFRTAPHNFWERIFNDQALRDCDDLEKLLVGCEIISLLDQVDLLLAA